MKETPFLLGREDLVEKFMKLPFLKSFGREYISQILKLSKLRKYGPEEIIISEGAKDRWVYVIISGQVNVTKQGKELTSLDHPGDIFGELALVDGDPRSATVTSTGETVCLAFNASVLEELDLRDSTAFYVIIYRLLTEVLASRLRMTNDELIHAREGRELMEMYMKNEWYQKQ